jgi:competence protein ComEC
MSMDRLLLWRLMGAAKTGWRTPGAMAEAERSRWPLWLVVALGTGSALYFSVPVEPSGLIASGLGMIAILAGWSAARWPVLGLVAALALGFAAAKVREEWVAAPVLDRTLVAHLSGRIESVERRARGVRLVLADLRSGAFGQVPARARIALTQDDGFRAGEGLSLTAQLMPPPAPSEPGTSDFGRDLFFDGVGAVGFSCGRAWPAPLAYPAGWLQRLADGIENLRQDMTARLRTGLPGSEGAIASALITGMRGGIDPDDEAALRDAGLAHVLAIAGLHMALVGMGLFWLVRAVLAAFPSIALNHPIKKWAAGAALAGAGFYLVISGAAAPATRAFAMLAMMLLAIMLDRPALSMRSLALAAALLLLLRPESITQPGFQMSFAAVTTLVAVAEWEQRRERVAPRRPLYRYLHGIVVTSLVGSLATMPFAIFHFDRAARYAVPGNLLAMPVMGFVVMPAAALSVAAMPFGLEAGPLHLLGWGIDLMLAVGRLISGLPGAVSPAPAFPVAALALMALGGLWLALWRLSWRWLGLLPLLAGVIWAWMALRPDVLIAADTRTIAVREADGRLAFLRPPKDRYAARDWLERDGDPRPLQAVEAHGNCDGLGCVTTVKTMMLAASLKPEALAEDCRRAALVISVAAAPDCAGPRLMLDGKAIAKAGGYAIRLTPQIKAVSVNEWRGARPWVEAGN